MHQYNEDQNNCEISNASAKLCQLKLNQDNQRMRL